jgi:hypothetical protein
MSWDNLQLLYYSPTQILLLRFLKNDIGQILHPNDETDKQTDSSFQNSLLTEYPTKPSE